MCGIAGYISNTDNAVEEVINILNQLEYRGYDSSGIAFLSKNKIEVIKSVGKISNLIEKIDIKTLSPLAIAHTRWATHGEVNEKNSHPHVSENLSLVHNGIIENYLELKEFLITKGYKFYSWTDTEVVCKLIDYYYLNNNKDKIKAIFRALDDVVGSYALAIIFNDDNKIYAICSNSSLIITKTSEYISLSSDVNSLINKENNEYYYLDNKTLGIISQNNLLFINNEEKIMIIKPKILINESKIKSKDGYETFMLKEINQQPPLVEELISRVFVNNQIQFNFDQTTKQKINESRFIRIIACGTAFNAGFFIKYIIERMLKIKVECVLSSEFKYDPFIKVDKTINFIISQSGETADTIAALRMLKEHDEFSISITNSLYSTIAVESSFNIDMKCGIEYAVASTKAYTIQCLILHLLTLNMASIKNIIKDNEIISLIDELKVSNSESKKILKNHLNINKIVDDINIDTKIFFLGRNINYPLATEASLKFKEITYINSNAYPSGELKHGTISLVDKKTLIFGIISSDDKIINEKTISNMKETKSRGAKTIYISNNNIDKFIEKDDLIIKSCEKYNTFSYLCNIYSFQLLSYYTAKKLGNDIDQPRNLAKSVTVE